MTRGNYDRHVRAQRAARRTADGEADDSAPATSRRSRAAWTAASQSQTLRAGRPIAKRRYGAAPTRCRLRMQCCGRSPQVQSARAARARVQARAGSRPGSRAAMARPAADRVGVQPPGRHRRSRCASTGPDACVARPRTACGWHGCCAHVQSYANSRRSDPCRRCRGERGRLGLRGQRGGASTIYRVDGGRR